MHQGAVAVLQQVYPDILLKTACNFLAAGDKQHENQYGCQCKGLFHLSKYSPIRICFPAGTIAPRLFLRLSSYRALPILIGRVTSEPTVSVIIPSYNRYLLLAEAVESVRAQSFRDLELIVVDDGSDDETPLLAREPDIRYLRIEHSGMPGAVRNRGVEVASGKYIAFLDSDDLWRPEKLERQLPLLEADESVPLVHTREEWLRGERTVSQKSQRHRRSGDIFSDALWKCTIGPSTVLMRRALFRELGGFDETLEVAEDYEFWLRLTSRYPVAYIDEALTVKRAGEWDQLSAKYGQIEEFRIESLFRVLELDRLPQDRRPEALAMLEKKLAIWSVGALKRGKGPEVEAFTRRLARL